MGVTGLALDLCPLTLREANDFVQNFHRHNKRTPRDGGKFAVGATCDGLVGVAIVGNPLSATFMDGYTAEVTRLCVNDDAPKGCCSKLYMACWRAWRAMGGRKLITYTLPAEGGRVSGAQAGVWWRRPGPRRPDGIKKIIFSASGSPSWGR